MSTPKLRDTAMVLPGAVLFNDEQAERIPPDSFLVLKYGKTHYTKGETRGEYEFTPADADKVIADFAARDRALVIDWEHQTLTGQRAPAAGWIESLQKNADGVVAKLRSWTAQGIADLKAGAYRYFSPVLTISRQHPLSLHSVGLTNHPATHGVPALVASDDADSTESENQNMERHRMDNLAKVAEALGVKIVALADGKEDEAGTLAAVVARIGELKAGAEQTVEFLKLHDAPDLGAVTGKIKGMVPAAELTALTDRLSMIDAEKAVAAAFSARKLTEAQREWAIGYAKSNPQGFADFLAKAPQAVPVPAKDVQAADGGDTALALTDEGLGKVFDRDATLRDEFRGDKMSFIAYRKAEAAGQVRRFTKQDKE